MVESEATRVSEGGDQDASMEDVGRPPGVTIVASTSFAEKVKDSNGGGLPVPERELDDEFVASRMAVEFPDGEDGEPVITIGQEVLTAMNGLWKQCLIVKVLSRHIPIAALTRKLRELWKPKGGMSVLDLPRQFFMVRFEAEEDYMVAVTGGPWRLFGSMLMVQAWTPEFDPLRDDIETTPVWVRMASLPVNFYHRAILMGIAEGLGKPIRVDLTTLKFERARFARVCVEVNLKKPLKGTVMVNGERYYVSYEGLSNICPVCGVYGHVVTACPKKVSDQMATMALEKTTVTSGDGVQSNDGFTVVRRSSRRGAQPAGQVGSASGGAVKEIPQNKGLMAGISGNGNIAISNSFRGLVGDKEIHQGMGIQEKGEGSNIPPKKKEVLSNMQFKASGDMWGRKI